MLLRKNEITKKELKEGIYLKLHIHISDDNNKDIINNDLEFLYNKDSEAVFYSEAFYQSVIRGLKMEKVKDLMTLITKQIVKDYS